MFESSASRLWRFRKSDPCAGRGAAEADQPARRGDGGYPTESRECWFASAALSSNTEYAVREGEDV